MVGFELAGPLIAASILDNHIKLGEGNIFSDRSLFNRLFLTIKLLHAVVSYFAQIVLVSAGTKAIQQMRHDVFKHVQSLPIRYFDNLPAGKVVARITNDTESILQLFASVIPMFMVSILTIFSITAIVFYVHFWTGIVMLLFIPVILIWGILYKKYSNENNHIKRERNSDMNAMINESINGMPIIQVFNREEQIRDEFEKINDEYYDSAKGLVKLESLSGKIWQIRFVPSSLPYLSIYLQRHS